MQISVAARRNGRYRPPAPWLLRLLSALIAPTAGKAEPAPFVIVATVDGADHEIIRCTTEEEAAAKLHRVEAELAAMPAREFLHRYNVA